MTGIKKLTMGLLVCLMIAAAIMITGCASKKTSNIYSIPCQCYDDDSYTRGWGVGVSVNRQEAKEIAFFEAERIMLSKFSCHVSMTWLGDSIVNETTSYMTTWKYDSIITTNHPLRMEGLTYDKECEKVYYEKGKWYAHICLRTPKNKIR